MDMVILFSQPSAKCESVSVLVYDRPSWIATNGATETRPLLRYAFDIPSNAHCFSLDRDEYLAEIINGIQHADQTLERDR